MTNPLAAADFFALEAGECLDRLEIIVGRPDGPPAEEFLRTSRVLRGSALMAGQQPIARAAAGLEALARAYRDGRRVWDPGTREQVVQAVEEFRLLVRKVREWGEAEAARTVRLGLSLEALAGRTGGETVAPATSTAASTAACGRSSPARVRSSPAPSTAPPASLRASPGDREPLYTVIRRMQSLRGLAELSELTPLPEILDGIELAVGDLTRLFAPPPGVDEVMAAGSMALTRLSRDIAEHGRPEPESEEASRFTELLLRAFAVERDVVPIESLYFADDPAADVTAALAAAVRRPRPARPAGAREPRRASLPERRPHRGLALGGRARSPALPPAREPARGGKPGPRSGRRRARRLRPIGARGARGRRRGPRDARARELPARGRRAPARRRRRGRPHADLPPDPRRGATGSMGCGSPRRRRRPR